MTKTKVGEIRGIRFYPAPDVERPKHLVFKLINRDKKIGWFESEYQSVYGQPHTVEAAL